ncbi:hypothetical protein AXG93_942s1230 [Marchantia polymorpha subsp. ruderalis]|uniref:Uncharacterized protein n=1 Tax=Marchantia polymorpha subsp. ruderalis TaxID=1480154 RepID=A0A176WBD4_MARPO|nr:hypothetical protein AXG93_942s1230 [Marchantia polymorpha subsp. ruderalis]
MVGGGRDELAQVAFARTSEQLPGRRNWCRGKSSGSVGRELQERILSRAGLDLSRFSEDGRSKVNKEQSGTQAQFEKSLLFWCSTKEIKALCRDFRVRDLSLHLGQAV